MPELEFPEILQLFVFTNTNDLKKYYWYFYN